MYQKDKKLNQEALIEQLKQNKLSTNTAEIAVYKLLPHLLRIGSKAYDKLKLIQGGKEPLMQLFELDKALLQHSQLAYIAEALPLL